MEKKTIQELELLKQAEKDEKKRVLLSLDLYICPDCGNKLKIENSETLKTPEYCFFGLVKKTARYWDHRTVCNSCGFEDKYDIVYCGIE